MAKLRGCGLAALVLALIYAAPAGAQTPEKVRVALDWAPIGSQVWIYIAEAKGWFKQAGLDVVVTEAKGGTATAQQVTADQIDIGYTQLTNAATARAGGMALTSVAGYARGGDLAILVPKSSGIKTIKELEGKRVGYPASGTAGPLLVPFLKASGADPDKVNAINVDANSLVSVYVNHNVDAIMTTMGFFLPIADEKLPSTAITLSSAGMILPGYGLMVSDKLLHDRPTMLAKFVPVANRAWSYVFDNHVDEAVDAMMKAKAGDRLDRKLLRAQAVTYMSEFNTASTTGKPMGWQSEEDWIAAIKTLEIAGVLKPGTSKPSDFYTNQFIK